MAETCSSKKGVARVKCEAHRAASFVGSTTLAGARTAWRVGAPIAKRAGKATGACIKRCAVACARG